ncbi:MAG: DUF2127 domain-containing protein [Acidobacteriaceae bacterium]|nr:DUF2127 domain-containing protein [Acidobacteriaceae bacterium]
MSTKSGAATKKTSRHDGGLLLVALFKLGKALFFVCVGFGALHLVHRDVGNVAMHIASIFRLDTEGPVVRFLLDRADLIQGHQLRRTALFALLYSGVCVVEGTGLYLEKVWAEYFTITLTVLALPWEIYELIHDPNMFRAGLLVLNLVVLGYLLLILRNSRRKRVE